MTETHLRQFKLLNAIQQYYCLLQGILFSFIIQIMSRFFLQSNLQEKFYLNEQEFQLNSFCQNVSDWCK